MIVFLDLRTKPGFLKGTSPPTTAAAIVVVIIVLSAGVALEPDSCG